MIHYHLVQSLLLTNSLLYIFFPGQSFICYETSRRSRIAHRALASYAFRKICSAVKKAALSEQSIAELLFDYYPFSNITKATLYHEPASLPLLG